MKVLTLVLCILALLGSAASGYFWWSIGNTKKDLQTQLAAEQAKSTGLQANLAQTSSALEQKNSETQRLESDLGDARRSLTAAQANNLQASREIENLKSVITTKEETEAKLNADLDAVRRELAQTRLAAQVGSPEELEKARQTIASLEARITEMKAAAASTPVARASSPADGARNTAAPAAVGNGRVVQVGRENTFVVIELGSSDGVTVGRKFAILRNGVPIAEAVVSDVKATFVVAQVSPSSVKSSLRAGDQAAPQK